MLSLEGRQLGNYDVIRRIRSGGMGAVYEGRQRTAFDRRVAIKVILGNYAADPDMRRRFAHEAKTIARLHHPHILPLIEFGDEQGMLYLVMPFIDGGTLTGYLRRHLPEVPEVATIFQQMLDAVEYAHDKGLIHRDIKSSNVLLESRRSGAPYAYLADFGLVRTIQHADLEAHAGTPIPLDQVPGTPQYMAPEQTRGIVTTATDIYALGVLLFQMLTGELPFNDPDDVEVIKMHLYAPVPNPCTLDASIPAELGTVVARAMAKRAEQRFKDIAEFREAFLAAITGPARSEEQEVFPEQEEEDFAVYELPQRPPLSSATPRASQQLLPPEPIAFVDPAPASIQRSRTTDDQHDLLPPRAGTHRPRTTEDSDKASPPAMLRRSRTTGDHRDPALPPAGSYRPRTTGESVETSLASSALTPTGKTLRSSARLTRPRAVLKKRRSLALLITLATLVFLLILVLVPRAAGLTLFPTGFPLLGPTSVATISVEVKTRQVQNTFLLTASPQVTQTDEDTRIMPDRLATSNASGNRTVNTSGIESTPGTRATGMLSFDNSGPTPATISANFPFTASNGVQVRLDRSIVVPARTNGQDGLISRIPATAIQAGSAGNLAAGAINTPCCGGQVLVTNPSAFSGGSDTGVIHQVAQTDLDSVQSALTPDLQQKVAQQISGLLQSNEVEAGTPVYKTSVTSSVPVGSTATQVTVTVTVTATALIYNTSTARNLAQQLLIREAGQELGSSYQAPHSFTIASPSIEQVGTNGQIYLNVAASGLWTYKITQQEEQQWRQVIKGASLALAQSYLSTRPGIVATHIQLPFNTSTLPASDNQIVFILQP